MSFTKNLIATLTSCALASQAFGEVATQVSAQDESQAQFHSQIRVSHVLDRIKNEQGELHNKPFVHVRPQVGLKLTDPGIDFTVVGYLYKNTGTTAVESSTRAVDLFTTLDEIAFGPLSINPFLVLSTPYHTPAAGTKEAKNNAGTAVIASLQTLSTPSISLGLGELTATVGFEVGGTLTDRTQQTKYQKKGNAALGLQASEVIGKKEDSDFYHETSLALDFEVDAVDGLSLSFSNTLQTPYETQYVIDENDKTTSRYVFAQESFQRASVSYALSDRLNLRNELSTYQTGAFASAPAAKSKQVRNELQLIYSL